jgi:hypothetical protein
MGEHVEKMVKQFAMTNASPSTCVRMLHRMDDRLYDVQTVANIFNNAKKGLLEEKGVDTHHLRKHSNSLTFSWQSVIITYRQKTKG